MNFDVWTRRLHFPPLSYALVGGAVLVFGSIYLSVQASRLRGSVPPAESRLSRMRLQAADIMKLRGAGNSAKAVEVTSLSELEQSAENAGLRRNITALSQSSGEDIVATLNGSSFNRLIAWLDDLRLNSGVRVQKASFEPASEPGTVNARLVIR